MAGESELDRALQRLVDDLELAVMRMPSGRYRGQDGVGPGGIHVVQEGEYLDLIIEKLFLVHPFVRICCARLL